MKMRFLISRCWQFAFAFCISISAADLQNDLPEDLKQIRNYFNNPPAITNLTFVMTNYITGIFSGVDALKRAMKSGFDPAEPAVDYCAYSYDPQIPGAIFRSFPAEHFDENHSLTNLTVLENPTLPDLLMGRSNHIWWTAMPSEITGLSFSILTNSHDGSRQVATDNPIRDNTFSLALDTATIWHHFGFGMFEAGTWEIRAADSSNEVFDWRGVSATKGEMGGEFWRTNNNFWMMTRTNAKGEIADRTRLLWNSNGKLPQEFYAVKPYEKDGAKLESVIQAFVRVDSPMIWWSDYPDAFHFNYHTNQGKRQWNSFAFYTTDGKRIPIPLGRRPNSKDDDTIPAFSTKFLRFALFIFIFGCIGFFLWRYVLQKKQ